MANGAMVDCTQFLEGYSEFRDGMLDLELHRSFEGHLAVCASCARYDRVVCGGARLARELPPLEPSCDFLARLQHRIYHEDEELRAAATGYSGVPVPLTAAIVVAIALSAWTPALRRRPPVVNLPPVAAHAPHRVEAMQVLFRPGPFLGAPDPLSTHTTPAANLLFYRYSPVGSYVSEPPRTLHTR